MKSNENENDHDRDATTKTELLTSDDELDDIEARQLLERIEKVEQEVKEMDWEPLLPEDSFSLMVTSRGLPLACATIVFVIHLVLLILLCLGSRSGNNMGRFMEGFFGFPVRVANVVIVTQFIAIFIMVVNEQKVASAIIAQKKYLRRDNFERRCGVLIQEFGAAYGLDEDERKKLLCGPSGLSLDVLNDEEKEKVEQAIICMRANLLVNTILRGLVGVLNLHAMFILVMNQTAVLEVLLNFAALEFVTNLDTVAFELFRRGFFGKKVSKAAKKVSDAKTSDIAYDPTGVRFFYGRSIVFFIVIFFSWAGYIVYLQKTNALVCNQDLIPSDFFEILGETCESGFKPFAVGIDTANWLQVSWRLIDNNGTILREYSGQESTRFDFLDEEYEERKVAAGPLEINENFLYGYCIPSNFSGRFETIGLPTIGNSNWREDEYLGAAKVSTEMLSDVVKVETVCFTHLEDVAIDITNASMPDCEYKDDRFEKQHQLGQF